MKRAHAYPQEMYGHSDDSQLDHWNRDRDGPLRDKSSTYFAEGLLNRGVQNLSAQHTSAASPKRPRAREQPGRLAWQIRDELIDLDFSDRGRDPRFAPGWWIVPGIIFSILGMMYVIGEFT